MFVVLHVKEGLCYFEAPGIDKYSQVALVEVTLLEESKDTKVIKKAVDHTEVQYVLGDFVEHSYINQACVGVVGVRTTDNTHYAPIKLRRITLSIRLADKNLKTVTTGTYRVVLHLEK